MQHSIICYLFICEQIQIETFKAELNHAESERDNAVAIFNAKEADLLSKIAAANENVRLLHIFKNTRSITRNIQPTQIPEEEDDDEQDSVYETTPLSDDDNEEHLPLEKSRPIQRKSWIARHSGSKRLTISTLCIPLTTPTVNECISFRDANGSYTTYIHLDTKCRVTGIKDLLSKAEGVLNYKIVRVGKGEVVQDTRHFRNIAAAILSNHKSLKIETIPPFGPRGIFKEYMNGKAHVQVPDQAQESTEQPCQSNVHAGEGPRADPI